MHQQVRVSIQRSRTRRSGAVRHDESLVEILTLLQRRNLRSAGRTHTHAGGEEFVFSIQHADGDDSADLRARDLLRGRNYEAEVFPVRSFVLEHRGGALLRCIRRLEAELKEPVIEVYVLAAEPDGKVPVQLVTPSMLRR
jgi:hypothetical protein